jgi:hypothetical protein
MGKVNEKWASNNEHRRGQNSIMKKVNPHHPKEIPPLPS